MRLLMTLSTTIVGVLLLMNIAGCGVSKEKYAALANEKAALEEKIGLLNRTKDTLKNEYDILLKEKMDLATKAEVLSNEKNALKGEYDKILDEKVSLKAAYDKMLFDSRETKSNIKSR